MESNGWVMWKMGTFNDPCIIHQQFLGLSMAFHGESQPPRASVLLPCGASGMVCSPWGVPSVHRNILWMEEILHHLVDGLSHCNPIIYSVL